MERRQRTGSGGPRPTMTVEMFWSRAYSAIADTSSLPVRIAVSAPSSWARLTTLRMRARSSLGSRCRAGVSTYTAVHSSPSWFASRAALRTTCSAPGPGPMQHSSRPWVFHTALMSFAAR